MLIAMSTTANTTDIHIVFAVRVTDQATSTDHLVADERYTVAKLLGRGPRGLCGTQVRPASLLHPHGPVCDDCAQAQAARRLTAVEHT